MTNPSVLIISGVRGDTRRYRSLHLAEQLACASIPVDVTHITASGLQKLLKAHQPAVVVFQRVEHDAHVARLQRLCRSKGALTLYDTDDLVFDQDVFQYIDSPDFSDPVRARLYRKTMQRHAAMLQACDAALVSTPFLADRVAKLGKPVYVHRNTFSAAMLHAAQQAHQARTTAGEQTRVVLGYASGTRTHDRDFAVVRPVLQTLLQQYPQAQVWVIGALDAGDWQAFGTRFRHLPAVAWQQLPGLLAQFDINLAPLVHDNPFARAKSEIKWMEAALLHLPTVASPADAFCEAIEDGQTGFLAHEAAEWQQKLACLIETARLRHEMGEQAYQHVLQAYAPQARASQLVTILNDLLQKNGRQPAFVYAPQPAPAPEMHMAAPSNLQLGWYQLCHRSLWALLGMGWVWLRRLLAPVFPFRPRQ